MPGVSFSRCVEVGELQRALLEEVQVPATGREPRGIIRLFRPWVETLSCPPESLPHLPTPSHLDCALRCLACLGSNLVTFSPRKTVPYLATISAFHAIYAASI